MNILSCNYNFSNNTACITIVVIWQTLIHINRQHEHTACVDRSVYACILVSECIQRHYVSVHFRSFYFIDLINIHNRQSRKLNAPKNLASRIFPKTVRCPEHNHSLSYRLLTVAQNYEQWTCFWIFFLCVTCVSGCLCRIAVVRRSLSTSKERGYYFVSEQGSA